MLYDQTARNDGSTSVRQHHRNPTGDGRGLRDFLIKAPSMRPAVQVGYVDEAI
jgi:hypothetical protein